MSQLFSIPLTYDSLVGGKAHVEWQIPPEVEDALQAFYPRPAVTLEKIFRIRLLHNPFPYGWDWMLVVLPAPYRIAGYLAHARGGQKANLTLLNHDVLEYLQAAKPPNIVNHHPTFYPSEYLRNPDIHVSMFWVPARGLLQAMGRRAGGWLERLSVALSRIPPDRYWVYLADAPTADELAEMKAGNAERYRAWELMYSEPPYESSGAQPDALRAQMLWNCSVAATGEPRIHYLESYLSIRPDDHRAWAKLALDLYVFGKPREALVAARRARRLKPGWYYARFLMALSAYDARQFKRTLASCRMLLAHAPLDLIVLNTLQYALSALGDRASSMHVLEQLASLDESHTIVKIKLGLAYASLGRLRDAEHQFARAAELDHDSHDAFNNYGYMLALRGEYPLALAACMRAYNIKRTPDNLDSLGFIYMEMGQCDRAKSFLAQALRMKPDHAEAKKHMVELTRRVEMLSVNQTDDTHAKAADA